MSAQRPRIHLIQNISAHYTRSIVLQCFRSRLFDLKYSYGVNDSLGIEKIDFGESEFSPYVDQTECLKSIWLGKKYLIWQGGVVTRCLFGKRVELVILLGEVQIVSNWLAAIACRLRGIPIAFRGHGLYGNECTVKKFVRTSFYRLANTLLVYERRAKNLLIEEGFDRNDVHVFFNSLDYDSHKLLRYSFDQCSKPDVYNFFKDSSRPTIVFIGRLTIEKKLMMLLQVVERINCESNLRVNLLVIGDGEQKTNLTGYADENLKAGSYHFTGECYDQNKIAGYLSKADLCVSPGNVGLTCIHSLSLGTPVCTHSSYKNQMPEFEAIVNGKSGILFKENDIADLYAKVMDWIKLYPVKSNDVRASCFEIIDRYYNPSFQEKVILQVALQKEPIV